jgi:hypothetical protein
MLKSWFTICHSFKQRMKIKPFNWHYLIQYIYWNHARYCTYDNVSIFFLKNIHTCFEGKKILSQMSNSKHTPVKCTPCRTFCTPMSLLWKYGIQLENSNFLICIFRPLHVLMSWNSDSMFGKCYSKTVLLIKWKQLKAHYASAMLSYLFHKMVLFLISCYSFEKNMICHPDELFFYFSCSVGKQYDHSEWLFCTELKKNLLC